MSAAPMPPPPCPLCGKTDKALYLINNQGDGKRLTYGADGWFCDRCLGWYTHLQGVADYEKAAAEAKAARVEAEIDQAYERGERPLKRRKAKQQ